MTEPTNLVPDPLDALLRPPPSGGGDGLRQRLLERTTRALRLRRRLRFAVWAGALAACYVAGLATMYGLLPGRAPVVVQALPAPPPPAPPAAAPPDSASASAVALEWKAFDSEGRRPDLYRQAGDRYAHDDGDPASALRCYGQSLKDASDKDLAISTDDDYLLMVVKEARLKEKQDAKNRN